MVVVGAVMRRIGSGIEAVLLASAVLLATSLPGPTRTPAVEAQSAPGRVLGSTRGQVAWLDLAAPRPSPLTQLVRPTYPADVDATAGVSFAVASVVSAFGTDGGMGGDLVLLDLPSGTSRMVLGRRSDAESLDVPVFWPDGHGILFQRSNLRAGVPVPGQATPQYRSQVEEVGLDGSAVALVLDDARYPSPAPDGSRLAFVRSLDRGMGIYVHTLSNGSEVTLVPPGQFLALAYPRFSPDGQQLAFAAISLLAPVGDTGSSEVMDWLGTRTAVAHGFPWEAWLVAADGSNLRQIPDVLDDDPSVAWSPDGTQIMVYGGWGSYLVDAQTGSATSLPYLAGYGSIAWLPN